jgi:rhamnosyltransferase
MPTNEQASPKVSVIIPTYNAGPGLRELLDRLFHQSLQPYEVIVIDSTSPDGTAELARAAGANVFTVLQSEFDHGGTRNRAAAYATGDVLVFMTQDAIPADEHLLKRLVEPLSDERTGYVYGRQLAREEASTLERISREFNYPAEPMTKEKSDIPRLGIKTFFCSNVCSALRRETFVDMGRFPEPVIFNEDMFFAAKCVLAGYRIAYAADARVVHSHNYSLMQQFRRFFDNGISMRNNDWIYAYSAVGKEGSRLLRTQLRALAAMRKWHLIPVLLADNAAKLVGYQLGKQYRKLPRALCARFSMHRKIWDKLQAVEAQGMSMKG